MIFLQKKYTVLQLLLLFIVVLCKRTGHRGIYAKTKKGLEKRIISRDISEKKQYINMHTLPVVSVEERAKAKRREQ